MLRTHFKAVVLPMMTCAMLALAAIAPKAAHAQALSGSVGPSTVPAGYFHCTLSGVWDDPGISYALAIFVDGQFVYYSVASITGPTTVTFALDTNVGALAYGSSPASPIYTPLKGTHTCQLKVVTPDGTLFNAGPVTATF
jgi:hypothetical protein